MLDFLLCLPLFFAFVHMMVVPPPSKRRRRGRSEQHQEVLAAGATETDTELLDRAGGFFTQANLDATWVNRAAGTDVTWRERILQAVTHWKMVQQVQPPLNITRHKFLKTKSPLLVACCLSQLPGLLFRFCTDSSRAPGLF